jgi:hypothetical protein
MNFLTLISQFGEPIVKLKGKFCTVEVKKDRLRRLITNIGCCLLGMGYFPLSSIGQISTLKAAPKAEQKDSAPYDSLQNFLGENANKYIGQELYLKGRAEQLQKYGYEGFFIDYNKDKFAKGNVYQCCDSYNSKYSEMAGKYFKVIEVIKHPKASESQYLYGQNYFLKLQEKTTGSIVYFEYKGKYEHSFPFIVTGFYEKQKGQVLNKEFVFADKVLGTSTDIETGKVITTITGQKWKCIDFTVEEKYYSLALVIQNPFGEKTTISYDGVFGKYSKGRAYSGLEADNYKKKFGAETFNIILEGKCKIGMSKEMCRLSWGEPKDINETITTSSKTEQWVYSDNYLYFENGILKTIQ